MSIQRVPPEAVPLAPAALPRVAFDIGHVQPATALYIGPAEFLRLRILSQTTGTIVTATGRVLGPDGVIKPFAYSLAIALVGNIITAFFPLAEGFLLGVVVSATPAQNTGATWASVALTLGGTTATATIYTVLGFGPVNTDDPIVWPPPGRLDPLSVRGNPRAITVTTPAAGAEWTRSVNASVRWRLLGATFQLVTAVAVAARAPTLVVDDGTNILGIFQAQTTQAASLTRNYSATTPGGTVDLTQPTIPIFLSGEVPLATGYRIRTITQNLQAADQYQIIVLYVEEFVELG